VVVRTYILIFSTHWPPQETTSYLQSHLVWDLLKLYPLLIFLTTTSKVCFQLPSISQLSITHHIYQGIQDFVEMSWTDHALKVRTRNETRSKLFGDFASWVSFKVGMGLGVGSMTFIMICTQKYIYSMTTMATCKEGDTYCSLSYI
jgi:hypothetical protein